MRNFKLNVKVELRQVKHYTDHKIVFLSIIEATNAPSSTSMKDYGNKRYSLTAELEILDVKSKKEEFK